MLPAQTDVRPFIGPTAVGALIVTVCVAELEQPSSVIVYIIVSVPAVTPVTTPAVTVAELLLAVHAPPAIVGVNVILLPAHTEVAPLIVPAAGSGLTVSNPLPDTPPSTYNL